MAVFQDNYDREEERKTERQVTSMDEREKCRGVADVVLRCCTGLIMSFDPITAFVPSNGVQSHDRPATSGRVMSLDREVGNRFSRKGLKFSRSQALTALPRQRSPSLTVTEQQLVHLHEPSPKTSGP